MTMNQALSTLARLHTNGFQPGLTELMAWQRLPLQLPLPRPRQARGAWTGQQRSRRLGRGMEYAESRHYQPGDDIRAIDWRVTARSGKTHTKLYQEEKEQPVYLMVDYSPTMLFGSQLLFKSVQAAHAAAALAWGTAQRGDRVGGLIFSADQHAELRPQSRRRGVMHLLQALVELHPHNRQESATADLLTRQLQRVLHMARPGTDIVLFSDFQGLTDSAQQLLRGLARHHRVSALILSDPLEQQLPVAGSLPVTDGHQHLNWSGGAMFRQQYEQHNADRLQERVSQLTRCGVQTLVISAALPLAEQWVTAGGRL